MLWNLFLLNLHVGEQLIEKKKTKIDCNMQISVLAISESKVMVKL